jgi:hypothetical protein
MLEPRLQDFRSQASICIKNYQVEGDFSSKSQTIVRVLGFPRLA